MLFLTAPSIPVFAGTVDYSYDATGRRLSHTVDAVADEPPQDVHVLYGDGIEVTNNNRYTVYHPEGRVSWVYSPFEETHPNYLAPEFQYEVMCRDHPDVKPGQVLGSVRATVSNKAVGETQETVIEEFHFYPFGMDNLSRL